MLRNLYKIQKRIAKFIARLPSEIMAPPPSPPPPIPDYNSSDFWKQNPDCLGGEFTFSATQKKFFNVVLPSLKLEKLSGGPNTVLQFALRLTEHKIPVRLLSQNTEIESNRDFLFNHFESLIGRKIDKTMVEFADFMDGANVTVSPDDFFMASAWWTAQSLAKALKNHSQSIFYFVQDFEVGFYGWGTRHALALEPYSFPIYPIVNSESLYNYLQENKILNAQWETVFFKPALDRRLFYFEKKNAMSSAKKTLLFYARPGIGARNLYEMGLEALYQLTSSGEIEKDKWDIFFIGEQIPGIKFNNGWEIQCLPWLSYNDYAEKLRTTDVVLSLMMSPHPSYTPLEAAACGNVVVTTSYLCKTPANLNQLSGNIIGSQSNISSLLEALKQAVRQSSSTSNREANSAVTLPTTWDDSLNMSLVRTLSVVQKRWG